MHSVMTANAPISEILMLPTLQLPSSWAHKKIKLTKNVIKTAKYCELKRKRVVQTAVPQSPHSM